MHLKTLSRSIRPKTSEMTFSETQFVLQETRVTLVDCRPVPRVDELLGLSMWHGVGGDTNRPWQRQ